MTEYYLHDGIDQKGPYTLEELKGKSLKRNIEVWHKGLQYWTPVQDLEELKDFVSEDAVPPLYIMADLPLEDNEDSYYKKKPRNLVITIILTIIALAIAAGILHQLSQKTHLLDSFSHDSADPDLISNDEARAKYSELRHSWKDQIQADITDYKYNKRDGISDLSVIVTNNTDKPVAKAELKLNYIKSNGEVHTQEIIEVLNIGPEQTKKVKVADSKEGVSVTYAFKSVTAPAFNFCYHDTADTSGIADPFYCK